MRTLLHNTRSRHYALFASAGALFLILAVCMAQETPDRDVTKPGSKNHAPETARLDNSESPAEPLRILSIGAHPADVFDQSGGTMAHHVKRGDWVGCVVMTTGVRVHDKVISDEMQKRKKIPDAEALQELIDSRVKVKQKEVVHACSLLGVQENDIHFLGVSDEVMLMNEEMILRLAKIIRELRPDVILTHYPFDDAGLGSEHSTTGQMVCHAISVARGVGAGDSNPPHKVTQVFFFGQGAAHIPSGLWGMRGGNSNDVFIDITDVADKKFACLESMVSQGYAGDYAKKRIETTDGAFGSRVHVPYAEGFISLNPTTHYCLPVSKIDLRHSKASDHESIQQRSFRLKFP